MSCSNIIHGLAYFCFVAYPKRASTTSLHINAFKMSATILQLITMGAAVEYFNYSRKNFHSPRTDLRNALVIALDSLLLFTMFINGVAIGSLKLQECKVNAQTDFIEEKSQNSQYSERYVPLKNSSQTLTPSIDPFQGVNHMTASKAWHINDPPTRESSDEISFPSVVKHKLSRGDMTLPQSESRKSSGLKSICASGSPRIKQSFIYRLRPSKRSNSKSPVSGSENNRKNDVKAKNIDDRYVTRLSTIPDLSRSVLNFINSSSADAQSNCATRARKDKTVSQYTDTSQLVLQAPDIQPSNSKSSSPALELERNAIERINSALLPPCLSVIETPPQSRTNSIRHDTSKISSVVPLSFENPGKFVRTSPNILERNDLGNIPKIPAIHGKNPGSFSSNFENDIDLPEMVTLDMWEKNKSSILQRAANLQDNILLPAFQFTTGQEEGIEFNGMQEKCNFSYPSKNIPTLTDDSLHIENNDLDTISAVEDYFNDISENDEEEESQLMQDGLKQDQSSSLIMERASKELIRTSTRHSPTKSIISIISGNAAVNQQRAQTMRSGYKTGSNDIRSLSQANHFFSNSSNVAINSTAKSSPTRSQRLKKMSKKLSISNISDSMINHSLSLENANEYFDSQKKVHERGRSIDFSYVHTLQSNHSPTKSTNGSIFKDRRHSLAAENGFRTASGLFYLQNGASKSSCDPHELTNTTLNQKPLDQRQLSQTNSEDTAGSSSESATHYPDVVMSEYDRERWTTLLSLNRINPDANTKA